MLARFLIALFLLSTPTLADIQRPKSLTDTLILLREAHAAQPGITEVWIDWQDQSVLFQREGDSEPSRTYPDNLHLLLQQAESGAERQAILNRFMRATDATPEVMAESILPVLRWQGYGEGLPEGPDVISRSFAGEIAVFYVQDLPERVDQDTLLDVAGDAGALHALALDNLRRYSAGRIELLPGDLLNMVLLDGMYESSLLLDDRFWNAAQAAMGRIVAAVPARDVLLFTDAEVPDGVPALIDAITRNRETFAYPISETLLEWTGAGWRVYQP